MTFSRGSNKRKEGGRFGDGRGRGFQNREQDKRDKEESQIQNQEHEDALEEALGFPMLPGGTERLGYLMNVTTVAKAKDPATGQVESSVDCYFVSMDSTMFKVRMPFSPYFFVQAKESMLLEVEGAIIKQFEDKIKSIDRVPKEDLDLRNHLAGLKRRMIRISFHTVSDLIGVRDQLQRIAARNAAQGKTTHNAQRTQDNDRFEDALKAIECLREYDVPYHQRFSIDEQVYSGCWYSVSVQGGKAQLQRAHGMVCKAEPKVCAFDIETTKLPMRFPNAESDQIFMISYMLDKQGFLIINREVVSQDITAFEYSPKADFASSFTVFNEKNEAALLRRWFDHMRKVQPSIYVTYNGDYFDWPFVEKRAEKHGMNMKKEIGFVMNTANECLSRCCPHLDCMHWVNRDSYLPQGSRGLKNVTKAKLGYNPVEVDPEKMVDMARTDPQSMASYSVSDAVATYYLYMVYIHPFVFSLATIIPMPPDEVLRKGSGTLCESLLMVKAFENNIIFPNKHDSQGISFHKGHVLESETYIGGKVEGCECGVFRADLPLKFHCRPGHFQGLIDNLDQDLKYALTVEGKKSMDEVKDYEEVKGEIQGILEDLRDRPNREECPLIYHLDVAAMYPNIILTNRLQPTAVATSEDCAACEFNKPNKRCLRKMNWVWRGEHFPAERDEYRSVESILSRETFSWRGRDGVLWEDLPAGERTKHVKEKLKDYCRRVYKRMKNKPVSETREAGICMRENSFYVDTVQEFRDRRYEYKGLTKTWKGVKEAAKKAGDKAKASEASDMIVLYDSLQLAHKCILNSFYGYVMRKGARWFSMEMAGVVTHTGANIIQNARELIEGLGRPLELDTDGIWCALPKSFPEDFKFKCAGGKDYKISYPCVILNTLVAEKYKNDQYQRLVNKSSREYQTSTTMSIEFEVDGPYQAMILPASQEEGKSIKKRYAVFNLDGSLAELKGFEIKRRGELQLIKAFQADVFREYLKGNTLQECYNSVAKIANRYLDIVQAKGWTLSDEEVLFFIMESSTMSKSKDDYGDRKSMAITCASRLAKFLADERLNDKGLTCRYIVSQLPQGASTTERVIPVQIFQTKPSVAQKYLTEWCGRQGLVEDPNVMPDIRNIIDWDYYRERLSGTIQKIVTIPAELQGIRNPVPRVVHPNWLRRNVVELHSKFKQQSIKGMLVPGRIHSPKARDVMDIEDVAGNPTMRNNRSANEARHESPDIKMAEPVGSTIDPPEPEGNNKDILANPICEDMSNPQSFIKNSKRKWRAALEARKVGRVSKSQVAPRGVQRETGAEKQPLQARSMSEFVRGQQEAVRGSDWHIVQIAETGTPGILQVWALAEACLFSFQLTIPKIFYIASDVKLQGRTPVKKNLPPGIHATHLYQEACPIQEYATFLKQLSADLAPLGASVHEDRLPDWLSAGIKIGCVVSLAPSAKLKDYSRGLDLQDIQIQHTKENKYLDGAGSHGFGPLHPILVALAKSPDDNRAIYAVVNPPSGHGELVVVDPDTEPKSNETSGMVDSLWREVSKDLSPASFHNVDFMIHVVGSSRDALVEVNRAVARAKDRASGPTVSLVSSPRPLQAKIVLLQEMPYLDMWTGDHFRPDYASSRWRSSATHAAFSQCLKAHRNVQKRIEDARYCHLPVGMSITGLDWLQSAADILFARSLRAADHVLWAADTSIPETAVHRSIDADEYYKDEAEKTELLYPGVYRTVCVELRVYHMEVSAIINAGLLYHAEGVLGSKWIRVVSGAVRKWANDACNSSSRGPTGLVNHFYQWISNPESAMYHPEIKRQLDQVILSMLRQAVTELRKLEVTVVKADCTSIIVATGKHDIPAAKEYLECILETIGDQELFSWLVMKPTKIWHSLLFRDAFNYHGIEASEDESPDMDPVLRYHWNLKDFLPRLIQIPFVSAISEFLVRPHRKFLKLGKPPRDAESQELTVEPGNITSRSAALKEHLHHDLKTHFITSLGAKVLKLLNCIDEFGEEDISFPVLPGSHLTEKELGSAPLAFVRNLIHVMSLDSSVTEEVEDLNRNLLRLMGLEVFSPEVKFQEPCSNFIMKDAICRNCGSCSTLDCCRDTDLVRGQWACQACTTPYEKSYIQKRLLSDLSWLNTRFQLQCLRCQKCKQVARSALPKHCSDCGGNWESTFPINAFQRKVLALQHMAEYNGFDAVVASAQRLLCD